MQKIGISKLKENHKELFSTIKESKIITFDDHVDSINSVIIKPYYINLELVKNSSSLKLTINTDIKIIYLKDNDTSLYVHKSNYINHISIPLPKIISGHYIYDSSLINKLKKEIFVENINIKLINNSLIVGYFLSVNIKVTPTYYLAYSMNNGFCDNIFLSHINGQVLTQKTFNMDMKCSNIKWSLDGSKLCYLATINNENYIYLFDDINSNVNKIVNVNIYGCILDFIFKTNSEIIVSLLKDNYNDLYVFNIKRNQLKKLTNQTQGLYIYNPYYDTKNNIIYYLSGNDSVKHLYSIDNNSKVDTLFNFSDVIDFYVSHYLDSIIIKVIKDSKLNLFSLDIKTKFLMPLPISISYEDILDIKFLNTADNKEIIILTKNIKDNSTDNSLVLYNLNNFSCRILFQDNINQIDIDYITMNLFLVTNKNNLNNVECISIEKLLLGSNPETILTLPIKINTLSIKKVANEK